MIHQERFSFETTGHRHVTDLTGQVAAVVGRSGVKAGIVLALHAGGAVHLAGLHGMAPA